MHKHCTRSHTFKKIQNTKLSYWKFKRNTGARNTKQVLELFYLWMQEQNDRRPLQKQERGGGKQDVRTTHIFKRNYELSWLCSYVPSFISYKAADWNSSLANASQKCHERIYTSQLTDRARYQHQKEVKWCLWVKTDTGTASGKGEKPTPTPPVGFCTRTAGTQTVVCVSL